MDVSAVIGVLNDLPRTFRRPGPPYTQFVDSTAKALSLLTEGADATWTQALSFDMAVDGWLDTWGLLWGVPRNPEEGNVPYSTRIRETILAWVATVPAIERWINLFATGGSVDENASGLGYVITLPPIMTTDQINLFLASLNRIRPAGVPFVVFRVDGGLYLGTVGFAGSGSRVQGDYLTGGLTPVDIPVGATTLSARPLLPSLLFADPTINPSLAPTG